MDDLGFRWRSHDLLIPALQEPSRERALWRAKKVSTELVYDAVVLEGNPFTYPEVQTLMEGITVGGHKVSDAEQILDEKAALDRLFGLCEGGAFALTKEVACELQGLAARGNGRVTIGGTNYVTPPNFDLDRDFERIVKESANIENPIVRGIAVFLSVAVNKLFYDANIRTGRLLMNGILLDAGQDIITIPAAQRMEFKQWMIDLYDSGDATDIINLLAQQQITNQFESAGIKI